MNSKQLACVLLVIGILVCVQLALTLQKNARAAAGEVDTVSEERKKLETQLFEEKKLLTDWQSQSADLREFVKDWEPYFAILEDQQAVETGMSMKVREEEMFNLSQSYQSVPHRINNKDNEWLPTLVRASLVFDDDYAKLLNWIGQMERSRPTMRIGRISLSKGSQANAIKMDVVIEIPLLKQ
jgi:hypothetical protein